MRIPNQSLGTMRAAYAAPFHKVRSGLTRPTGGSFPLRETGSVLTADPTRIQTARVNVSGVVPISSIHGWRLARRAIYPAQRVDPECPVPLLSPQYPFRHREYLGGKNGVGCGIAERYPGNQTALNTDAFRIGFRKKDLLWHIPKIKKLMHNQITRSR